MGMTKHFGLEKQHNSNRLEEFFMFNQFSLIDVDWANWSGNFVGFFD